MRLITLKPERSLGQDSELRIGFRPLRLLSNTLLCCFRAVCVQSAPYPAGIARRFHPFVDLLLTRGLECQKPPGGAALKRLI